MTPCYFSRHVVITAPSQSLPFSIRIIPRGSQTGSVAFETDGVTLETESAVLNSDNLSAVSNMSIASPGILRCGIEVYDGKEYSEEEFFVCDVRLLTFVPGKVLHESPLNNELLFNAGMAVGRLDRDLEVSVKVPMK